MKRASILLALMLQACAGREPATAERIDPAVMLYQCGKLEPSLSERLRRAERMVQDLRAEEARRDFEYVLEILAWLPPFEEAADLRRRAGDGLVHVRGILQER